MKRIKWRYTSPTTILLFSLIITLLSSYANCDKTLPVSNLRQLEPVNRASSSNKELKSNNHLMNLNSNSNTADDETSGEDFNEDDEEGNLEDDEEYNEDEESGNGNGKANKEENFPEETNDDQEDDEDEDSELPKMSNNKKNNLPTLNKNNAKNEPTGFADSGDDEKDETDDNAGTNEDEKDTSDKETGDKEDTSVEHKEQLNTSNKDVFNRDKKVSPVEHPANNLNNLNNLNNNNKPPTIVKEEDEETDDGDLEEEDTHKHKNITPEIDSKDKRKDLDSNYLPPPNQDLNLDKSKENFGSTSSDNGDDNLIDNSSSYQGRKDLSKPTSLFAQPLILAVVIGSAVAGLLISIVLVMIILYRLSSTRDDNYYC